VREYLSALMPLLRGEAADFRGEAITAAGRVDVPGAGRPAPRIVADVVVIATADAEDARERIATALGAAGDSSSYRSMLDRQGKSGIHETVIAGDERVIEQAVRAYAEAGVTELMASMHGSEQEKARTLEVLSALRNHQHDE
jgi:alkanesulfonate monooxygenase SsuD/methylene tetrahydromethanopterin reductase-like flavin-dependent oxidoreductase (luciferase family)